MLIQTASVVTKATEDSGKYLGGFEAGMGQSLEKLEEWAARQGKGELAIMKITGHCSLTMLKRYIREADRWRGLASAGLLDDG